MDDNFEFQEEQEDDAALIARFESMLSNGNQAYFDPDELEDLFNHYLFDGDINKCADVVALGVILHPNSLQIKQIHAQLKFEEGELRASLDRVNDVLSQDDANIDAYLLKAQIFIQLEERKRAIKYLFKAADLSDPEAYQDIIMDISMEYQTLEDYDSAIIILSQLLEKHPDNHSALYELAYCYDLAGKLKESISFYKVFLDKEPYSFVAWYNLGNAMCKLGNYSDAVSAFDFAIAIKDDLSSAHFNKGNALAHLGLYEASIESFEETIKHEGTQAITLNYIGESYEKLKKYDEAFSYYMHASELDPDLSEPWIGMGVVKDLTGQHLEALKYIEKAVQTDQSNAANWVMLGNAYEKNNRSIEAEEAYLSAIDIQDNLADAWFDYSNLLLDMDQANKAVEVLITGLEKCPNDKDKLEYRLAACLFITGKKDEAMTYLEHALQINFGGHKDLLEYCPEISERSEVIQLIESYSNNNER